MLNYRLSGTEWSRDCGNTALSDREQCIDYSLSCYERHIRNHLFFIWSSYTYRPFLHQCDVLDAVFCLYCSNGFLYGVIACLDRNDSTLDSVRDHDLLLDDYGLLNDTDDISGLDLFADSGKRLKGPLLLTIQSRYLDTSFDVSALLFVHLSQRTLDTIVDTLDEARPQLY